MIPQEILKKILVREPVNPRRLNPDIPRDLAVIALKAMEKDEVARLINNWPNEEAEIKKVCREMLGKLKRCGVANL